MIEWQDEITVPGGPKVILRTFNPDDLPDNIEDPYLAKAYLEMAYELEAEIAKEGWDQPPLMLLFRAGEAELDTGDAPIGAHLVEIQPTPLPGFEALVSMYHREGGRTHHAVVHAADAWRMMAKHAPIDLGKMVQGAAVIHEAWALHIDRDNLDPSAIEARNKRQIHEHPNRVEIRTIQIAGPNGLRIALQVERDGVPRHLIGQAKPFAHVKEYYVAGDMPNALHYFLEVAQGQTEMEWEEWEKMYDYSSDDLGLPE